MTKHKYKVGDRVVWESKRGNVKGTIRSLSVGWEPPRYFIEFDKYNWRFWVTESEFLTRIGEKEVVVFT